MALLAYRPLLAARWQRPLLYSSAGILVLLILALGFRMMLEDLGGVLDSALPVVLLVTTMTLLGLGAARALRIDAAQGRTIAIEIGLQNFNLAMVIALSILEREELLGPALIYLPTRGLRHAMFDAVPMACPIKHTPERFALKQDDIDGRLILLIPLAAKKLEANWPP